MNIVVIGAGGVGSSIAAIAQRRNFFDHLVLADISLERAQAVGATRLDDGDRFAAAAVDASRTADIVEVAARSHSADVIVNACDPRLNPPIFDAAFAAGCHYIDMAMHLSAPAPRPPLRARRREARRRPVRRGRAVRGGRPAGARGHGRRARPLRRVRPLRRRPPVRRDRRDRGARRRQPRRSTATTSRRRSRSGPRSRSA